MNHRKIISTKQLANYLRCDISFLEKAINEDYLVFDSNDQNTDSHNSIRIDRLYIKKKGQRTGFRAVYSIYTYQLSNSLKILNGSLNDIFVPAVCVHGFVKGKSIKTNAYEHISKRIILSVDIENFFESITDEMVSDALQQVGFQKEISESISKITTVNKKLVQGFNTSPTLANIVVHQMDLKLMELCGEDISYTRYADDLYFSTNSSLPNKQLIEEIINSFGFELNASKTKIMKRGQMQYVTGLTAFDNIQPRIPRSIKRNLRLEIYYIRRYGYFKHAKRRLKNQGIKAKNKVSQLEIEQEVTETRHRLFGWIHYIQSIEPDLGKKLYSRLIGAKDR